MKKIKMIFLKLTVITIVVTVLSSCGNQDVEFPDFKYQTVYFANQYPGRTITLGEHEFVNVSLDNEHKAIINATTGGVYQNKKDINISFRVDESLCNNLFFANGTAVIPMPSTHYTLSSNDKFTIPARSMLGGVEVKLTDAFFADPLSVGRNYVIPLVMTNVQGADTILKGDPAIANPDRCIASNWTVAPKDFVLYGINYVNPWHGNYLRRGVDQISGAINTTNVRHSKFVETDQGVSLRTSSMTKLTLSLSVKNDSGGDVAYVLELNFTGNETCTVSGSSAIYEATGTGKFVKKGDKLGGLDADVLHLDYTVKFPALNQTYATKDTLVLRDRGVSPEYFTVTRK